MVISVVPLESIKKVCERPSSELPEGGNLSPECWPALSDVALLQSTYCADLGIQQRIQSTEFASILFTFCDVANYYGQTRSFFEYITGEPFSCLLA
jgi:hypothetical protein